MEDKYKYNLKKENTKMGKAKYLFGGLVCIFIAYLLVPVSMMIVESLCNEERGMCGATFPVAFIGFVIGAGVLIVGWACFVKVFEGTDLFK